MRGDDLGVSALPAACSCLVGIISMNFSTGLSQVIIEPRATLHRGGVPSSTFSDCSPTSTFAGPSCANDSSPCRARSRRCVPFCESSHRPAPWERWAWPGERRCERPGVYPQVATTEPGLLSSCPVYPALSAHAESVKATHLRDLMGCAARPSGSSRAPRKAQPAVLPQRRGAVQRARGGAQRHRAGHLAPEGHDGDYGPALHALRGAGGGQGERSSPSRLRRARRALTTHAPPARKWRRSKPARS